MENVIISRISELSKIKGEKPTVSMVASGVGKDLFYNLRNNRIPSINKIIKLADYFNVTTDYILGRSDIIKEASLDSGHLHNEAIVELVNHVYRLSGNEAADVLKYIEFIHSKRSKQENETVFDVDCFKPKREESSKKISK